MSTTVLTDEQVGDLYQDWHFFFKNHPGGAANCIRAIEQAVLQSEQVQAWKKDAERLRYILDRVCMIQAASYGCKFEILNLPPHFGDCEPDPVPPFVAAIDAAIRSAP